jgi:peptidase C13-like protein
LCWLYWLCGRDQFGKRHAGLVGRVAVLWLALFELTAVVPAAPVFLPSNFDARTANWCEILSTRHAGKGGVLSRDEIAQFQKTQSLLLQQEFAGLTPSRKGETEIYTLAIAGWADLDVFVKELNGALAAMASVLPIKGRTVRLVNHRETVNAIPLANFHNFTAAVHAIGNNMDKDNDILILLMTSHGDRTGFALQLPGSVTELTPRQVAAALDGDGIKNRVVIVSACYSGIFVPPLANDNTIVMTAADAHHPSFGCAPERDWTYFGDAFFRQSLHPGADFKNAFDHARVLIHRWEMMDRVVPSNPQGSFGSALVGKLAPFFATNPGQ